MNLQREKELAGLVSRIDLQMAAGGVFESFTSLRCHRLCHQNLKHKGLEISKYHLTPDIVICIATSYELDGLGLRPL
jgi:hypothetical protein